MKTLKMFGMAAIAVFMGVGFASCAKDDGNGVSGKKLTKIVVEGKYGETVEFKYDSNGRLTEVTDGDGVYQYIWGDDAIKVNTPYTSGNHTYALKNGLVQSWNMTLTYNQSNRPIKMVPDQGDYEVTYIWDGDKLVSASEVNEDYQYGYTDNATLTYEKTCKKGYSPLFVGAMGVSNDYLFMAHPELLGARTTQLPANVSSSRVYNSESGVNSSTSYTYDYELDNSGYISKIHRDRYYVNHYEEEERSNSSYTFTLTWE